MSNKHSMALLGKILLRTLGSLYMYIYPIDDYEGSGNRIS